MSLARYAKRRDANESGIVKCLERCGAAVWRLDVPADLLIFYRGKWQIAEVKDGAKPPSARKLTEDQERAHAALPVNAIPILTCIDDALRLIAAMGAK